jgi:prevent-host-death family protein
MKEVTLEQLSRETSTLLDAAQREKLLVTREGKPLALVVGIENLDAEDWDLATSPEFWRMIEERRREPTVPLEQVLAEIEAEEKAQRQEGGRSRAES